MAYNLHPGPLENDLLHLNNEHRAPLLFNGSIDPKFVFTVRRSDRLFWSQINLLQNAVKHYINVAGFGCIIEVGNGRLDNTLITALIERWRPETHTFHFPRIGETTVTLQDVQILWGLRVGGYVVSGLDLKISVNQWRNKCTELLGFTPLEGDIKKGAIKLSCLLRNIQEPLPAGSSDVDYIKKARVYILHLIGGTLFPNNSGNFVYLYHLNNLENLEYCGSLSWGSAVLAYLYRRLCKATKPDANDVCGPLSLLQLWAWERISTLAPTISFNDYVFHTPYGARWNTRHAERSFGEVTSHVLAACRSQLTTLTTNDFNWTPYTDILHLLPRCCIEDQENWRCETYLIYWEIAETHAPSRVMRQFGMFQAIPEPPLFSHDDCVREHNISRSGRSNHNWETEHEDYIDHWQSRDQYIQTSNNVNDFGPDGEYIRWFNRKTVQYIINPSTPTQGFQPLGEHRELLMDGMSTMYNRGMNPEGGEAIPDISQRYMEYIHSDDRIFLGPSNFVQNYEPVPQQQFQRRATPRPRQRQANLDIPSTSNVGRGTTSYFPGSSSVPGQETMQFSGHESMHFQDYYTPIPSNNEFFSRSSPSMMPLNMDQSYRPERNFSPIDYNFSDFDLGDDSMFMGLNENDPQNQRPARNRRAPDCGTGRRLGDH